MNVIYNIINVIFTAYMIPFTYHCEVDLEEFLGEYIFDICIADLRIRIDNMFEFVKRMCRDYIVLEEEDADLFVFATAEELIQKASFL